MILYLGLYVCAFYDVNLLFPYRTVTPVLIWVIYDCIMKDWTIEVKNRRWMHGTFFIYCTHFFVINIFQKIIFKLLPHTPCIIGIIQVVTPLLVFPLLAFLATRISSNRIYKVMIGGR